MLSYSFGRRVYREQSDFTGTDNRRINSAFDFLLSHCTYERQMTYDLSLCTKPVALFPYLKNIHSYQGPHTDVVKGVLYSQKMVDLL